MTEAILNIDQALQRAAAHHQVGRLQDAERIYRQVLSVDPANADGLHLLGVIANQTKHNELAVELIRKALSIKPDFSEALSNLGNALRDLGRLDEAIPCYKRALAVRRDYSVARINLGITLNGVIGKNDRKKLFGKVNNKYQGVRNQYENLPFPSRDPEADNYMLVVSIPDILGKINQYCFGGSRDYSKNFRVLVAGCGTGDSVIWLAHQLKDTSAEIVAIDISEASLEVAKTRAKVRNLTNIRWIHGSLLDLSTLGLGRFDYITCLGVLHHLPVPVEGLKALESVLADDGAMAIMVYGAVGRSHIYAMQNILRQLTAGLDDPLEMLAFSREIVANLPATNGFRLLEGAESIQKEYLNDDSNFWDTLLHEQDRAYTASEVREFIASVGLFVQGFISYQGRPAIANFQYDLDFYVNDPTQQARLKNLTPAAREDIAEVLDGRLTLHTVYATRAPQSSLNSPSVPRNSLAIKP